MLRELSSSVLDAEHKPYLRSTLHSALSTLEYEEREIEQALDRFYSPQRLQ